MTKKQKEIMSNLQSLYGKSTNERDAILEMTGCVVTQECREIIEYYLEKVREYSISQKSMGSDDIENILTLVHCAQAIFNYTGADTGMTDSEYDILYEYLNTCYSPDMDTAAPVIVSSKGIVTTHRYKSLRGTLDKIYYLEEPEKKMKSRRSLGDWVKSSERTIKQNYGVDVDLWNEDVYVFPKWDGVSVIFEYEKDGTLKRALTRGFTETNECQDITHIFRGWIKGPVSNSPKEYGEKTEVMMTNENLDECNLINGTDYKQSRSIVSSVINSDEVDDRRKYLSIISLRTSMLNDDGTETTQTLSPKVFDYPFIQCKLNDIDAINDFAMNHRVVDGLRCDGAVIYIISPKIQEMLGRKNNRQKFEVAFKFTEESTTSKIKDVRFTLGLFNSINPVARIKPVKLKGNEITNVSLGSMDRFMTLGLCVGDKVNVLYDIIPYLTLAEHRGGKLIEPPRFCPVCGEDLEWNGDELFCVNDKCPNRTKGKILNYLTKMHIDGISYATIDLLYDNELLKSIPDLYKFRERHHKLEKLPGLGKRSVQKMIDEIESHMTVPSYQLLGSIGISGIGLRKFKVVMEHMTLDDMMDCDSDELFRKLMDVPGIQEKTADKIIAGIDENRKLISKLCDVLNVYHDESSASKFSVCFTKIRDNELEKWIESKGGSIDDSLTKSTSALIVPMDNIQSSKVSKAERYGIPIIPISKAKDVLGKLISNNM